jgi:hypothetical protein
MVYLGKMSNNDNVEALERQRLLESQLTQHGFPCIVVGFDWATAGSNTVDLTI